MKGLSNKVGNQLTPSLVPISVGIERGKGDGHTGQSIIASVGNGVPLEGYAKKEASALIVIKEGKQK